MIGATHADKVAPLVAFMLSPLLRGLTPVVWFVNLFVQGLLVVLRVKPAPEGGTLLTQEELRSLVLEGSQYFRGKHRTMLANLMDLEAITVDDVMTPRNRIHALDLAEKPALLRQQLATSYHSRVPVYEESLDNLVGVLPLKSVVNLQLSAGELVADRLRPLLRPPYFIPAGRRLLTQLTQFQNDRQRLGLVVDEYGELQGLVTIEDIVEEIIGEFTTQAPGGAEIYRREPDGSVDRVGHGHAAHAEPPAGDPVPAGRAEDAQWAHRRAFGRHSRRRPVVPARRPADRGAADPGPRGESGEASAPRGAGGAAFTNPGRAGIIDQLSFMLME